MNKILVIFFVFIYQVFAQISPGPLTNYHSYLEGMGNCTKCHDLGNKLTNSNCLACHSEIKTRIEQNRGYHSSGDVKGKDCWKCHSEHNGKNFEIIRFKKNEFDHNKTKFVLLGAHKNLQCEKCHKQNFIINSELKKRKNTFLGLEQKCANCHEDYHKKTLGYNCAGCHDLNKFNPASLFDHNKTKFILTGMHKKVLCDKCHPKETINGKEFRKFKGLSFKNCNDCHKDFHNGKLGSNCQKCHNTSGFNSVNKNLFDHSKTNFILIGKHESVECSKCHGKNLASKPKHDNCFSCHKDYHNGQFTRNEKINDCSECHTEKGFSPSLFTIARHAGTKFILAGSHLAIPCKNCHFLKNEWIFNVASSRCVDCHPNIHGNELSQKNMGDFECGKCHNTISWNKINFDHNNAEFKLSGAHKKISCGKCHTRNKNGQKVFIFASLNTACYSCHIDVHIGQFAVGEKTECIKCHEFENWKPVKFDHSKTRFPLEGAHRNVDCIKCHKQSSIGTKSYVKYKIEDIKCAACHL